MLIGLLFILIILSGLLLTISLYFVKDDLISKYLKVLVLYVGLYSFIVNVGYSEAYYVPKNVSFYLGVLGVVGLLLVLFIAKFTVKMDKKIQIKIVKAIMTVSILGNVGILLLY